MLTELKKNPKRFKGNRILYIHSGTSCYNTRRDTVAQLPVAIFSVKVVSLELMMED